MDDLDLERTGPVRVAGKFRPKAKPKSMKAAPTAAASDLPNAGTENSNPVSSSVSDSVPSATSVDIGQVNLTCPVGSCSEISGSLEPSRNNEQLCSSLPSFDGDRIAKHSESAAGDTPQPSSVVVAFNISGSSQSVFGKSAGKNANIISGVEGPDNFHTQTTSGTVPALTKSPGKGNEGNCSAPTHCPIESSAALANDVAESKTVSDYDAHNLISCTEAGMTNKHGEIRLEIKEFEILDDVSDAPITSGLRHPGKFQPKLRVKKGKNSQNIPHSEVVSTTLPQAANFEVDDITDMDESSLCAFPQGDVRDHISPTSGDSLSPIPAPNFQSNAENLEETTQLDEPISNGAAHSECVCVGGHEGGNGKAPAASNCPQTRKDSAANTVAKDGTLSRKSRKWLPHQEVDDLGNNTHEDSIQAENCSDVDGNEDREHNTEQRKRAPRKSRIPLLENEKPVKKRKRTKKTPDEPTEEPTKKKFSHSTRRNKRRVEKTLLEIPEDEIDHQRVPMKDLIRLREYRERLATKEAAKLKASASNQSAYEFQKDPSHNEEEDFGFEQDRSSGEDQAGYMDRVSTSSSCFNYQSFMNKERPSKWVQEDTELFYEGIEQFGSDFNMIAQLFPGRTRHQIKLKFKKEDRQNPLRITEAFRRHSKDNSKYVLVINELQKVSREKQESNADEMNHPEELELTHDNDGVVPKPELDKIDNMEIDVAPEVQYDEADIAEVHSPTNSDQCDNGDGFGGWDDDF